MRVEVYYNINYITDVFLSQCDTTVIKVLHIGVAMGYSKQRKRVVNREDLWQGYSTVSTLTIEIQ